MLGVEDRQRVAAAMVLAQEAVRPGLRIPRAFLTEYAPGITDSFEADLHKEFAILSHLVGEATRASGGLVVKESMSDPEEARIEAIIKRAAIKEWQELRLRPLFEHHYKEVVEAMAQLMNKYDVPLTKRTEVEAVILDEGGTRAESLLDIKKSVRDAMFNALDEGRELGMNPREMASVVEHWIPKGRFRYAGSSYRARLIARTETMHAQRMGSIEMYRSSPAVNQCVALDGDEDEDCAARNGEYFSFEDAELEAETEHPNGTLCFGPVT